MGTVQLNKVHLVKVLEVPDGERPEGSSHSTVSENEDIAYSKVPL